MNLVAPATVAIIAVGTVAIAVIWPVIAIAVIWPVVAIAIIRVAIAVIATAILPSPIANLFNPVIAFCLKWQSSDTLHHCRLDFGVHSANNYKHHRGHHTGE